MLFVFVGIRGAGKSTLLGRLQSRFKILQPSTTRQKRSPADNEYDFVSAWDATKYAWGIDVGPYKYGMRTSEVQQATSGRCATVFDPLNINVFEQFRQTFGAETVTVGLDTITTLADHAQRVNNDPARVMSASDFDRARIAVQNCDLVISGTPDVLEEAVLAFSRMIVSRGGVLVADEITPLMKAGALISDADPAQIQSASYDLALGDQIWCQGELIELSDAKPRMTIPPYSYAIVTAKELAAIPKYVTGRFDLTVSLFLRGLVLSNGPQVDPGYRGPLFCMLFNGGGAPRNLVRGNHFATIEFTTTTQRASGYHQQYQLQKRLEKIMDELAISSPGGNIMETLNMRVESFQRELREVREPVRNTMWTFIGLMFAGFLVLLGLVYDRLGKAQEVLAEAKAHAEISKAELREIGRQERERTSREIGAKRADVIREMEALSAKPPTHPAAKPASSN